MLGASFPRSLHISCRQCVRNSTSPLTQVFVPFLPLPCLFQISLDLFRSLQTMLHVMFYLQQCPRLCLFSLEQVSFVCFTSVCSAKQFWINYLWISRRSWIRLFGTCKFAFFPVSDVSYESSWIRPLRIMSVFFLCFSKREVNKKVLKVPEIEQKVIVH